MNSWHDVESARDEWIDAPLNDDVLEQLLDIAQGQVIAYAPKLRDESGAELDPLDIDVELPTAWPYYQLQQARNIWNASKVDPSGGAGEGDFVIRPFPLDWMIRQGLRPRKAVPRVR